VRVVEDRHAGHPSLRVLERREAGTNMVSGRLTA
jgi:hypothetical protein